MRECLTPYLKLMRLHQPTGIWLLLWPCWWAIAFASQGLPDLRLLAVFALGAVLMRSAGCIINDIIDKEFDAKVERTKDRPLASGALTNLQAMILLVILLLLAGGLLLLLNRTCIILGLSSLLLVGTYPFMKRITYWPQAFLGLTFNWGALMGWAAVSGGVSLGAGLLYGAGICWTLGYDTIYAHQDKSDDKEVGVKSTAVLLGQDTKRWLKEFYKASMVLLAMAGIVTHEYTPFYYAWFIPAVHLYWQVRTVNLDDSDDCMRKFRSNTVFGALVFVAIVMGKF